MERPVRYFFLLSILLLALTALLLFRESRPEWKQYQEKYKNFLYQQAQTPAEKNRVSGFAVGVKQDWLPELDRADRCRSCHVGVDNPAAPEEPPLAPHPDISPHSFEKFGCTVCHGGEGLATRLPDAHEKLLPIKLIEAGCGKCHGLAGPGIEAAPTYTAGSELLGEKICAGCHLLSGDRKEEFHGPNLQGLHSKVNKAWLAGWLKNPRDYLPHARMANFLLSKDETDALTTFLLDLKMPGDTATAFYKEREAEQKILSDISDDELDVLVDSGKVVFGQLRCLSCHELNGKGGSIGPDLSRLSQKTNRSWLSAWLRSPSTYNPQTRMPTFNMTTMERLGLIEYLFWESEVNELNADAAAEDISPEPAATETVPAPARGREIFLAKGCFNCHQLPGVKGNADFAPPLKDLADKKIEKIDFGKTDIPRTLPDYIVVKLQNPRVYGDKLKMPYFGLSPLEAGRLTTVLLGRSETVPASYRREKQAPEIPLPAGEVGGIFDRYKCLSCHKFGARGGRLAPDLAYEGSKVRKGWLQNYMLKPYAIRPYLVARMPRFKMTEREAETVAQYAEFVLRNSGIDSAPLEIRGDPDSGRRLYFEKYVCQSCHSIAGEGGYYGPALENTADRLQPAWIDRRLMDAHPYEPGAREPALAIPGGDRQDILAFLGTLKEEAKP